jgi:hypothetical protein
MSLSWVGDSGPEEERTRTSKANEATGVRRGKLEVI